MLKKVQHLKMLQSFDHMVVPGYRLVKFESSNNLYLCERGIGMACGNYHMPFLIEKHFSEISTNHINAMYIIVM